MDPALAAFDKAATPDAPDPALAAFDSAAAPKSESRFSGATAAASARVANVIKAKGGDPSAWDYPGAILKGVAHAVGVPTNADEIKKSVRDAAYGVMSAGMIPAANSAVDMLQGGLSAYERAKAAPTATRTVQAAVSGVPFVGAPISAVAEPQIEYNEGMAPTHEANVAAVEGGTTLAAMGAMAIGGKMSARSAASKARITNALSAKGVPPEAMAQFTPEEVALADQAGQAQAAAEPRVSDHAAMTAQMSAAQERIASTSPEAQAATTAEESDAWAKAKSAVKYKGEIHSLDDASHDVIRTKLGIKPTVVDGIQTNDWPGAETGWAVDGKFVSAADIDATPRKSLAEAVANSESDGVSASEAHQALVNIERQMATRSIYDKHISKIDAMDVDPGERYRIDELFDKNSKPEDVAAGKAIYDGFAKTRALLKEQHGETMPLVRYEDPAAPKLDNKTVTHWYDPAQDRDAAAMAKMPGLVARTENVPIDDIVAAPYYGKNKMREYIVANRESAALADPLSTTHVDASTPTPTVEQVSGLAKRLAPVKEIMDGINPAGASEGASSAADILRRSKSDISNAAAIERYKQADIVKAFDTPGPIAERLAKTGLPRMASDLAADWKSRETVDDRNTAAISAYEQTGEFPDAPAGYSDMYRETTDAAHEKRVATYGADRVGFVENYVQRMYEFGTEADKAKSTGVLSNWVGSLSANKSGIKSRALAMPLDAALKVMRDAGIDVKPVTTNPEVLRQYTVENANQGLVYKQAWDDAKAQDLIQFVKQGDRVPAGHVPLNDRVAQVFRPTEQGPVRTGQYFAEPGVARIFNNAISQGLGGSPTFKAIRAMNNAYNQMQLGLSGFHLTGTAINAGISDMALGLQQVMNGDIGAGAKTFGRGVAGIPLAGLPSFARDLVNGRAFINDLVADDPVARQFLEEKLNPAGGRLAIDQSYRNNAYDNMVKAWSNQRYIRALGNVPFAVIQKIASPLMEYAIPRVKIGAFKDLEAAMREKLGPEATPQQIQRAQEQAWDSIDNRFGQIVHDNLFWNRTAADLAQVSTRSVGWNLGTIRELGGGVVDVANGNISQRTLYALSLPIYAGTIGAIFQYLHTGKKPDSFRDYYYPQNGLKDSKGRDDRASLPTYMKDVFAYGTDPVATLEHKASPLLSLTFDLGTNRDYFGDMIRNPEETRSKQLLQMGSYALHQFQPFSVQQASKTFAEGGPLRAGEQMMGFPSAPASMKQTAAESANFKEARRRRNENAMDAAKKKHGG